MCRYVIDGEKMMIQGKKFFLTMHLFFFLLVSTAVAAPQQASSMVLLPTITLLLHSGCDTPPISSLQVALVQPASGSLQPAGPLTVSAEIQGGSGGAASLPVGWGIRFAVDDGQTYTDTTSPYSVFFNGLSKAEHRVRAWLVDDHGCTVDGSQVADEHSHVGIGDYYIAFGDSITCGQDDNWPANPPPPDDDTSRDGRNSATCIATNGTPDGGGFPPVLNDLLTAEKGYPHTVVNAGHPGDKAADGRDRLPAVLAAHPKAQYVLLLFGTNDAVANTRTPTTEFKAAMQNMIDQVKGAGMIPYLAKIPYIKGEGSPYTYYRQWIAEYNSALDDLTSENGLSAPLPDFYAYFEQYQDEIGAPGAPSGTVYHPTAQGYQAMAQLWCTALVGHECSPW